jgi:acetyltransferase-like isoleucine patch superfamily enzyme
LEQEILTNQRPVTWKHRLKMWQLKRKYSHALVFEDQVRILGPLPVFKLPGNGKIILGNKVVLNSDAENSNTALTYRVTLACGLNGTIRIGENSMLNGVAITSYDSVTIGKNCQIASCTLITDTDYHPTDPKIREREVMGYKIDHNMVNKKPVVIGNNVWIGWGCIILKGVTIGDNSIIAAGAVVTSDIPANALATGNPATVKKSF